MFNRVLKLWTKGDDVRTLQRILNIDGHGLSIDGSFGYGTRSAVMEFQRKYGLSADGYVGKNTSIKLQELLNRKYDIQWYNKYIQVISFKKEDVEYFDLINSVTNVETLPKMYKRQVIKPTLLFNGGLFDTRTGASASQFKDDGKLIASGYYSPWGLYINKDKDVSFKMNDKNSYEFLGFSPTMILNGEIIKDTKGLDSGFINNRHPRTAFAESKDSYHIIMVHGRRSWLGHKGMSIPELASFCKNTLKAINAGNFDGGGSCMLLDEKGRYLNKYLEVRGVDNAVGIFLK